MIWIAIIIVLVYFIIKYAVRNGIIEAHNYLREKDGKEKVEEEKDKNGGRHW